MTHLSVDGNLLSLREYGRPLAGPPSTVPGGLPPDPAQAAGRSPISSSSAVPSGRGWPAPGPGAPPPGPLSRAAQVVTVKIRAVQAGERRSLRFVQGTAVQPADQ